MGVMACSRGDCENILCDYYSSKYGHICSSCLQELINGQERSVLKFMNSDKNEFEVEVNDGWEDHINNVFGIN